MRIRVSKRLGSLAASYYQVTLILDSHGAGASVSVSVGREG